MTGVFVAHNSRWRLLLLLLGGVVFVVLGIWLAGIAGQPLKPGVEWIGWLSILFFGACSILIFTRLFDNRDQIRISSSGLYYRQWSEQTIPWEEMVEISVWQFRRQRFIVLSLVRPDQYPSTKFTGKMAGANRMLTGGDITVNLTGLDRGFDEAWAAIEYYRGARRRPASPPLALESFGRRRV